MTEEAKTLNGIKRWLKLEGNTTSIMAASLGFRCSVTINKWLERKRIPPYHVPHVQSFLRKDGIEL